MYRFVSGDLRASTDEQDHVVAGPWWIELTPCVRAKFVGLKIDPYVCVPELDWKRRLGSEFWYAAKDQDVGPLKVGPLKAVLNEYDRAVAEGKAAAPVPWYHDVAQQSDHKDSLYHLLQLRADHTADNTWCVLAPEGNTSDTLDYRMAWHLWTVLEVGR